MKYLGVAGYSIVILVIGVLRTEGVLRTRKRLYGENPKEHRKNSYIPVIVVWIIGTVVFAYLVFKP